jgi:uncharacterized protein YegP (UPF0339 family)
MYFEIETAVGGYVWRIRDSGNHEILASSEILRTTQQCIESMQTVRAEAGHQRSYWRRDKQEWVAF